MRAIEIIGRLREKYSNKYTKTPNHNKDHYIQWLQDEYAELVMNQANGAEQSDSNCNIPLVMRSAFNEAYEKWYNTKDDAELGNWLFAKSKGITP